jgi:hypothetical protein
MCHIFKSKAALKLSAYLIFKFTDASTKGLAIVDILDSKFLPVVIINCVQAQCQLPLPSNYASQEHH